MSAPGATSTALCKAACLEVAECDGILVSAPGSTAPGDTIRCYRKGVFDVSKCHQDGALDLFILIGASRPPPPSPPIPPPPTPPLSPRPPISSIVTAINTRWINGHPSNSLADVGVLLHQFDNLEDWAAGRGWAPCHHGWCANQVDHLSCSIVNANLRATFNRNSGVILAPSVARIKCAYSADGGTQGKPGGCSESRCSVTSTDPTCSWPPEQLAECLQIQTRDRPGAYNEIIMSADFWDAHLPEIIEAILLGDSDSEMAYGAHSAYNAEHPDAPIPLVRYNGNNYLQPFEQVA